MHIIVLIILLLSGCSQNIPEEKNNIDNVSTFTQLQEERETYSLYIEQSNIKKAKFEPQKGIYLGAYILANKQIEYDIKQFEELTEKKHAMYTYNMRLGEDFPENWVLSCISNMSTPNITIKAPNSYNPFNEVDLIKTAKQFSKYDIPMFIQFYPEPKEYNPTAYKDFFKKAYNIFNQYSPNIAFVYCVGKDDTIDYKTYYPGNNYVDWIGLNVYEPVVDENNIYGGDVFDLIDYFYYTFQKDKPIMLSQFAVSYYSNEKNTYYTNQSKEEIFRVYKKISNYYPRIKAITYMDFNGADIYDNDEFKDNFSITENSGILDEYKSLISNDYFLSDIDSKNLSFSPEYIKSPFEVYKIDNKYYISNRSLVYDMQIEDIKGENLQTKLINNEKYFDIDLIERSGFKNLSVDESNKKIFFYN